MLSWRRLARLVAEKQTLQICNLLRACFTDRGLWLLEFGLNYHWPEECFHGQI
jgi:hypothetical protein